MRIALDFIDFLNLNCTKTLNYHIFTHAIKKPLNLQNFKSIVKWLRMANRKEMKVSAVRKLLELTQGYPVSMKVRANIFVLLYITIISYNLKI